MAGDTNCHVCALNSGRVYTHHVRRHEDGRTLVDVLAAAYRHSDADTWQSHLRAGRVRLDGRENRDSAMQVREGQVISYAKRCCDFNRRTEQGLDVDDLTYKH